MLVLTRKIDEAVTIGQTIAVKVLAVRGNQVRLGISAPPDVQIGRAGPSPRLHPTKPTEVEEASGA